MGRKIHVPEKIVREKSRLTEPKFFKICPKCSSVKVNSSKSPHPDLPPQYKCGKCSYMSYFFPATTKERIKSKK